jgi:hypothetical protein
VISIITNIDTYKEKDKLLEENDIVAETYEPENQFDIWKCTLLRNKISGKFSLFLTADSDEQWVIIDFKEDN